MKNSATFASTPCFSERKVSSPSRVGFAANLADGQASYLSRV